MVARPPAKALSVVSVKLGAVEMHSTAVHLHPLAALRGDVRVAARDVGRSLAAASMQESGRKGE